MLIGSERLLVRPITIVDVDELVALHAGADVVRFIGRFDRERASERLQADQRECEHHGDGLLAVVDCGTGRFLGRVALMYWPRFDETGVGWVLRRDAWGQGFATEAARACVAWGFWNLGVPYLTAMIRRENTRCIRVAERLGMTPGRIDVLDGRVVV